MKNGTFPFLIQLSITAFLFIAFASVGRAATVAAPAFSPSAGTFTSAQSVSITSSTPGATIRYTTDGSTPSETNGAVYTSAIPVGVTTTLSAIAYETGGRTVRPSPLPTPLPEPRSRPHRPALR
jgi:hypothetical protein